MNPQDTQNNSQINFPIPPAGYDDNGQPFWIIEDRQMTWQEVEQRLWEYQRKQTASRGPEGIPMMPSFPNPEQSIEKKFEAAAEVKFEQKKENNQEHRQDEEHLQTSGAVRDEEWNYLEKEGKSLSPYFSKGAKTKVNTEDETEVEQYINKHERGAASESSTFLATLLKKILTMRVFRP